MSWIKNLKYDFGNFVIDIPQWEILDRGLTVLWGASGAGKTTTLRILLGLDGSGYEWHLGGQNIGALPVREKRMGVVFQSYDLFPHMSAGENVAFALRARGIALATVADRLADYKDMLGLHEFWQRPAHKLSGGEQQRIALVRALIAKPRVLFLDEPFSALDESLRQESRLLVKSLIAREEIPTILITHDKADVRELAARAAILDRGKIVEELSGGDIAQRFA